MATGSSRLPVTSTVLPVDGASFIGMVGRLGIDDMPCEMLFKSGRALGILGKSILSKLNLLESIVACDGFAICARTFSRSTADDEPPFARRSCSSLDRDEFDGFVHPSVLLKPSRMSLVFWFLFDEVWAAGDVALDAAEVGVERVESCALSTLADVKARCDWERDLNCVSVACQRAACVVEKTLKRGDDRDLNSVSEHFRNSILSFGN